MVLRRRLREPDVARVAGELAAFERARHGVAVADLAAPHETIVQDPPLGTGHAVTEAMKSIDSAIEKEPEWYGKQVLFLHSGGGFGAMAYADQMRAAMGG